MSCQAALPRVSDWAKRCCQSTGLSEKNSDDLLLAAASAARWYAQGGIAKYFRLRRET